MVPGPQVVLESAGHDGGLNPSGSGAGSHEAVEPLGRPRELAGMVRLGPREVPSACSQYHRQPVANPENRTGTGRAQHARGQPHRT